MGGLTVRKLNSATNEPLSGAEFRIVYADGRPVDNNGQTSSGGVYITNSNGEINITGITGTVVVTEERAPAGFSMDAANRSQTVVVNPAETQTVTFYNAPDQNLILQKYVKGTTTPIQGARFLVTDGDGRTVGENGGEFTTDENGRITVTGLKLSATITAKEIEAAQGYVLDATPKSATIRSGSVQSLTFYNEPCGTLVIEKRDAVTDAPLAGATFQVMNSRGEFVANNGGRFTSNGLYTTDDSGQIILTGLNPMTVVVKETEAPNGYSLNDASQTVEILPNDTQTLTFKNVPLQTLVITKYEEGTTKPLAGVTFSVTDGNGAPVGNGTYTTDANGQIVISGLPAGMTVVAREVRTVKGYHLNGVPQTIQIGTTGTSTLNSSSAVSSVTGTGTAGGGGTVGGSGNSMTFYDAPLATLVVRKFIDGTENEPLPGVEFRIVDGSGKNLGDSDGVFYTDAQGEIVVENLEIGMTVKVRETKTVDGFVLDGTPKDIEISSSDLHELVFWNQRQGGLTVRVRDSVTRETLAGVTFRITYADGRPVDDNNGQTSSNGIYTTDASGEINITGLTGTVVVTEQQTIDGYTMNPAGTTQTVVVNPSETQTLEFFDNPNQTLTIQALASDTNEPLPGIRFLVTDSEGTVVGPSNGEYAADQNGRITITNLVPGVTVTVKETESVSGYILNTQPQSIVIRQGEAQSLTFYNDPKGSLTLRLIDAVTEQFLTGGEFRITTAQGEPVDANEGRTSTNGIYRVDEEGRITVTGLLPGVYTVTQTKAPDGYVIAEEPQTVTIHADDAQTLTFRDTPLQTLVVQNYVAGTTEPLVRSEFLVTDGGGSVLGTENGVYRTDENGRFVVSGLRPGINVRVKQTAVTDGYLLNGNPQNIEIRTGDAQSLTLDLFGNPSRGVLKVVNSAN